MEIIQKDTYRSEGRRVNKDDNMVRLVITMSKNEYHEFIKKKDSNVVNAMLADVAPIKKGGRNGKIIKDV